MILRQLQHRIALAREPRFSREAFQVPQPTLSAAVRQLERDLGAPTIERTHQHIGLTPKGKLALNTPNAFWPTPTIRVAESRNSTKAWRAGFLQGRHPRRCLSFRI